MTPRSCFLSGVCSIALPVWPGELYQFQYQLYLFLPCRFCYAEQCQTRAQNRPQDLAR